MTAATGLDGDIPLPRSPKAPRNLSIDLLRGLALAMMMTNHLPFNALQRLINVMGGPFGFFTSNTIFFFLSGIVSGLVYRYSLIEYGWKKTFQKMLYRVRLIYTINVSLFITIATLGARFAHLREQLASFYRNPWKYSLLALVFYYNLGYLDILPLYCIFLFLTPLAVQAFRQKKPLSVLIPSLLFWSLSQFGFPPTPPTFGLNPFSFQLIFFSGLYFGCNYQTIKPELERIRKSKALLIVCGCIAGIFWILRLIYATSHVLDHWMALLGDENPFSASASWLISQRRQGLFRVLNFATAAYIVWRFLPYVPKNFYTNALSRWLIFLGQNPLQVFVCSVIFAYMARIIMPFHPSHIAIEVETFLSLALLAVPAYIYRLYRQGRFNLSGKNIIAPRPVF